MPNRYTPLIDRFDAGGPALREALRDVPPDLAQQRPPDGPGTWSIHELVIHLADMDAIGIDRMKRIVAEPEPALANADETAFIASLHPHAQSMEDAATLFTLARRQWSRVLRELPDSAFDRAGFHSIAGRVTLASLLEGYADHMDHHLPFIKGKVARLRVKSV